jgi:predicted TIM-barrel fold metal-dependent hydrolase
VAIALAGRHLNVYLEICGSHGHGVLIARMIRELGPHRIIYGSDFPFIDMRTSLGRVVFAGLDDTDAALVLGGNIDRLVPRLAAQAVEST